MNHAPFPKHHPWDRDAADRLLDMSGGLDGYEAIGADQRDAAIALHGMLLQHGIAYLADEVGMGKTYVALAVVALFRHLQPGFRVLYITPSRNVLTKWHERELPAFIRNNVVAPDMRIQGPAGLPPTASVACLQASDWLRCAITDPSVQDVLLPLSALSFTLSGDENNWRRTVESLAAEAGLPVDLAAVQDKRVFKDQAAALINQALPRYDLVIVDEAHLLKGGAGASASDRARFLARALGAGTTSGKRRFGGVLLMSGTPFDRDLRQLARQIGLFAQPALAQHIEGLARHKDKGGSWSDIQAGLKPFLIRREQKLDVGGRLLSRNQYRNEQRSEAGISLAGKTDAGSLRQRLFTAVVQKRLIEHLDGHHDGRFPMAMFSSWEAYAPPPRPAPASAAAGQAPAGDDSLDTARDGDGDSDTRAIDGTLMEKLVGSYRQAFDEEPPHPKLETEAMRLSQEAFGAGLKQLVFVRRLRSVDDLYLRLNQAYDEWLATYLRDEGMPGCPEALRDARRSARGQPPEATDATPRRVADDETGDEQRPARGDTLFSWFFSGQLDKAGRTFIDSQGLPAPGDLRERLRNPERRLSIIGELDWRGFASHIDTHLPTPGFAELADRASMLPGPATALGRHRRLQLAWAELQAEFHADEHTDRHTAAHDSTAAPQPSLALAFRQLAAHLRELLPGPHPGADRLTPEQAEDLLGMPTVGLTLYQNKLGEDILPAWRQAWDGLGVTRTRDSTRSGSDPGDALRKLDLQREVLFAILRLDHPFIDLYLGWIKASSGTPHAIARALLERLVYVCRREHAATSFGTGSILRNLAEGWEPIAKTNFARFLQGADRLDRDRWRREIAQVIGIFPVEWASGDNSDARSVIARRFRMPGYPMALVATSVLQEGEDLHVCCDRVTHFGISGSPIGIEQKNGRVDRIGSQAQRRLQKLQSGDPECVRQAGIQVRFPHLTESLEWYQIRDLSVAINEYLHSMHKMGRQDGQRDDSLASTVTRGNPIPALPSLPLESPFRPDPAAFRGNVAAAAVEKRQKHARQLIDHATSLMAAVARPAGFVPAPARPDCFIHPDKGTLLSLQPAHMTGELMVHASRRLAAEELPEWLHGGRLSDAGPSTEQLVHLTQDPRHKYALEDTDKGKALYVQAACFARGEQELQASEIEDLLTRVGHPVGAPAPRSAPDALVDLLRNLEESLEKRTLLMSLRHNRSSLGRDLNWNPDERRNRRNPARQRIRIGEREITLRLKDHWLVASCVVEANPPDDPRQILRRSLIRNARATTAVDYRYSSARCIEARITHPIAELGVMELVCILEELRATHRSDPAA